jgi:S-adenosylmethionine:tRNA-ribosyltransferase-isomerase (queuine synthetase)
MAMNDTRVTATRLHGRKHPTGGVVEALLLKKLDPGRWEAMVKPGRRVPVSSATSTSAADLWPMSKRGWTTAAAYSGSCAWQTVTR